MSTFNEIASALNGKRSGNGYTSHCPAHDDKNPSLSLVEASDGKILFHCHAGCSQNSVMNALRSMGLMGHSSYNPKYKFKSKTELALSIWDESKDASYPAATPLLLYVDHRGLKNCTIPPVIRLHPALPYYADGKLRGTYPALIAKVTDHGGTLVAVQRIYLTDDGHKAAVPEVKKSLGPVSGHLVYLDPPAPSMAIAEGIETALAVRHATQLPTCAAISAKGLEEFELPPQLQELHIFADKDVSETGQKAAKVLAEKMNQIGVKVFIHLPEEPISEGQKGIDWLDVWVSQGKGPFELSLKSTPLFQLDGITKGRNILQLTPLSELLNKPDAKESWILDKTLPTGGISLVAGKPKVGKTTLVRCLALAIARGEPFLNRTTLQGVVIYLALEEKEQEIKQHFKDLGATGVEPIHVYAATAPENALESVQAAIVALGAVLVIIDPILRLVKARDANDYMQMTSAFEPLVKLARESGVHILCVHHMTKGERTDGDGILGSQAIFGSVDTAILLNRTEKHRTLKSLQRYGNDIEESILEFDSTTRMISLGGTKSQDEENKIAQNISDFLRKQSGSKQESEIHQEVEGRKQAKVTALRNMLRTGKVIRSGSGGKSNPYRYTHPDSCSLVPAQDSCSQLNSGSCELKGRGDQSRAARVGSFDEFEDNPLAAPPNTWEQAPRREQGNKNKSDLINQDELAFPSKTSASLIDPSYPEDVPPPFDEEPLFEVDSL